MAGFHDNGLPEIEISIDRSALPSYAAERLVRLMHAAQDLEPVMEDVGEYMVRAIRNRLIRSKTSPDGQPWADLTDTTNRIRRQRGYQPDRILFASGELADSIYVSSVNDEGLEIAAGAEYAAAHQEGVYRTGGMIKNKQIPARPFMGFSEANLRRIRTMVRRHLEDNL